MEKKIVIRVDDDSAEPCPLFDISDKENMEQFRDYLTNYDADDLPKLTLEALTPEEWAEAERIGEEMA